VHSLNFKNAHLLISSPLGERIKVRGIRFDFTLTLTLSRQRERGSHWVLSLDYHRHTYKPIKFILNTLGCALFKFKSIKNGALLVCK